jgi:hypothetical protein
MSREAEGESDQVLERLTSIIEKGVKPIGLHEFPSIAYTRLHAHQIALDTTLRP